MDRGYGQVSGDNSIAAARQGTTPFGTAPWRVAALDWRLAGHGTVSHGGAATHGELAFFRTPENQPDGGVFGKDDLVAKAVLGASPWTLFSQLSSYF